MISKLFHTEGNILMSGGYIKKAFPQGKASILWIISYQKSKYFRFPASSPTSKV